MISRDDCIIIKEIILENNKLEKVEYKEESNHKLLGYCVFHNSQKSKYGRYCARVHMNTPIK